MATFSKVLLSGSTGGKQIKVAANATPGTTIHSTQVPSTTIDEIWLYATNQHTSAVAVTIEFGGTTSPDDLITVTIPAKGGLQPIIEGLPLSGDGAAARTVRAFAATQNVILISGFVNRIA